MIQWIKSKAFTLIEMMVAVVVLTIIVSIAIVSYQGYQDRVSMMVDETNETILHAAVRMNAVDTGTVAGDVSKLRRIDLERAYALVVHPKTRPFTLLAYLGQRWAALWGGTAEAADPFLPPKYYNKQLKVIQCPSDPFPPTGFDLNSGRPVGGVSYIIHPTAAGESYSWFMNSANRDRLLIIEADEAGGSEVFRHGGRKVAVRITVGGKSSRHSGGGGGKGDGGNKGGGRGGGGEED